MENGCDDVFWPSTCRRKDVTLFEFEEMDQRNDALRNDDGLHGDAGVGHG